jgi:hypothetical protein
MKPFHFYKGLHPHEEYAVCWGEVGDASNGSQAEAQYSEGIIIINPSCEKEFFWSAFIHEVVHSAEVTHQMKLCEAEVDLIANYVANALQPWLKAPPKPNKK